MDLGNLLTLRYDPSVEETDSLRKITYEDLKNRKGPFPSSKEVENALRSNIRKKITESGAEKISVALSTGVDSNAILSLIRDEFPNIEVHCVSVSFDEKSEAIAARKIAENMASHFHNVVIDNPLKDLPHIISILKEPRWNVYQFYFIEKSSQLSDLLFTGDGGDELFGGYVFRYKKFLDSFDESLSWEERVRLYLDCHERDWVPDQAEMFGPKLQFSWDRIYMLFKNYFDNDLDPLDQVFTADYHGKLMHDFVPANSKLFNHFKVTGIAPLLDPSVIDISMRIPPSLKYDRTRNIGKLQLRDILSRQNTVVLSDKKIGFGMDLGSLWTRIAKEIVTSTLDNGRIFEDGIINKQFYTKSLKRISDTLDVRYISKMLQLLSLEIWYKMFVTFEIGSKTSL
jgi:asparagine synthase (glutamine-hydrolysing)